MRKLIINADDFGLSDHTVDWTIRCFELGVLTSATIMAGMPATDKAVSYALSHPQFSFGVHFYLVDKAPMCDPAEIPSMIDSKTGKLWQTHKFILRNFAGLIKVEDLKREMRVQYTALKDAGVPISHIDGHGHNHRLPQSIKALADLKDELGFCKVRRCQNLPVGDGKLGILSRAINNSMQKHLESVGFVTTDYFVMNAGHTCDEGWFSKTVKMLPEGITEIGIHPGIDKEWRRIDSQDCMRNGSLLLQNIVPITYNDI